MQAREMISAHPDVKGSISEPLIACIESCFACALTCTSCADACVAEDTMTGLRQCIRLNLDCADVCSATGALASRRAGSNQEVVRTMIETCALTVRRRRSLRCDRCRFARGPSRHADELQGRWRLAHA
jgi:hypothetical protein